MNSVIAQTRATTRASQCLTKGWVSTPIAAADLSQSTLFPRIHRQMADAHKDGEVTARDNCVGARLRQRATLSQAPKRARTVVRQV